MIYRKLDANGDYTFGFAAGNFFKDSPEAVAQAVKTRLGLWQGEWFLDKNTGVPYETEILGAGTFTKFDFAIQDVIINTQGVTKLVDYYSYVDRNTRAANIFCTLDTVYGQTTIQMAIK